ncbi:MAG: ThiF family adenylyltransferase [Rikenellaceae bacterium]
MYKLISDIDKVSIPRAKDIILAAYSHSLVSEGSVSFTGIDENGDASIYFEIEVEIPQRPVVDIRSKEIIIIVCNVKDKATPLVFASREDFPLGLPHTNAMEVERPVSLCVTETDFKESKMNFSSTVFIDQIREWMRKAARGALHSEDQPLEPFFNARKVITIPTLNLKGVHSLYEVESNFYRIYDYIESSEVTYHDIYSIPCSPITAGCISKVPIILKDLDVIATSKGSLSNVICTILNNILSRACKTVTIRDHFASFLVIIPLTRDGHIDTPETYNMYFYSLKSTIWEIGVILGLFKQKEKKRTINPTVVNRINNETLKDLCIEQYLAILDFSSLHASLFGGGVLDQSEMTLIGVGSLGSNILDSFVRLGFGRWNLIDNDILLPHNLARHVLMDNSVGKKKVAEMAYYYNRTVNDSICNPIDLDFNDIVDASQALDRLKTSSLILDCSTSIQVSRILSNDINDIFGRRASVFLSPRGTDVVFLMEDADRLQRLDLLEMAYYQTIIENSELHDHLSVPSNGTIRYNRNSCREITSKIDYSNVKLNASIAAKEIVRRLKEPNAFASIWRIDADSSEVRRFEIPCSSWSQFDVSDGGWKVCINKSLIENIRVRRDEKLDTDNVETGGVLMGSFDVQRHLIYIYHSIPAPYDSIETQSSFTRGGAELQQNIINVEQISGGQCVYIGEWHSHPHFCSTQMSSTDEKLFKVLEVESRGIHPIAMMIVGDNDESIYLTNFKIDEKL